jgi:hypothetical protein
MTWNNFFALILCLSVIQMVERVNKIEAAAKTASPQGITNVRNAN